MASNEEPGTYMAASLPHTNIPKKTAGELGGREGGRREVIIGREGGREGGREEGREEKKFHSGFTANRKYFKTRHRVTSQNLACGDSIPAR